MQTYTAHITSRAQWLCLDCAMTAHNRERIVGRDTGRARPAESCNECGRPFPADAACTCAVCEQGMHCAQCLRGDACICGPDHDCRSTGCDENCPACC